MICQRCGAETSTAICSNCGYFNDEPDSNAFYSSNLQPTMTSKDAKDAWETENKAGGIHKTLDKTRDTLSKLQFILIPVAIVLEAILAFFAPSAVFLIGGLSSIIGALLVTVNISLILPTHILQIVSFRGYLKQNNIVIETPTPKNDAVYAIYLLTKSIKNIVVYSIYIAFIFPMNVFSGYFISFIPMIHAGFIALTSIGGEFAFTDALVAFAYTSICVLVSFIVMAIIAVIMNLVKNKLIK